MPNGFCHKASSRKHVEETNYPCRQEQSDDNQVAIFKNPVVSSFGHLFPKEFIHIRNILQVSQGLVNVLSWGSKKNNTFKYLWAVGYYLPIVGWCSIRTFTTTSHQLEFLGVFSEIPENLSQLRRPEDHQLDVPKARPIFLKLFSHRPVFGNFSLKQPPEEWAQIGFQHPFSSHCRWPRRNAKKCLSLPRPKSSA